MTPANEIHNRTAGKIVTEIVLPTIQAGGDFKDVLVLLESVVTGVLTVVVEQGGDDAVVNVLFDAVRERMKAIRLGGDTPAGRA